MSLHRRSFLKITGTIAAGLAVNPFTSCNFNTAGTSTPVTENFGIQLYTLRDVIGNDTKNVLEQLAAYGYKHIESYEGPQGMFWGMGAKGFKEYMDNLGMKLVASHTDIYKNLDRKAAEAASIGINYLVCPWVGPQKTMDDYKKIADDFNKAGNTCKEAGIKFAYHNHAYSFTPIDGELPQDVFMKLTDPSLVDYEMDIYWVVTAGLDPEKELKKHANRYRLCHVKDREKGAASTNTDASVNLGLGSIDFANILKTASKNGMQYYLVEQERYPNTTPMASARANAAYMKSLRI